MKTGSKSGACRKLTKAGGRCKVHQIKKQAPNKKEQGSRNDFLVHNTILSQLLRAVNPQNSDMARFYVLKFFCPFFLYKKN